jgi:4-hydroxy-2-oxoheptanedioate aldolase
MAIHGLQKNKLKEKIRKNEAVFGSFCFTGDPGIVEIMGHAGFDFVLIDMEHAPLDFLAVQNCIRAAECVGMTAVVRIGYKDDIPVISRVLDSGAQGLEFPHIMNKKDVVETIGRTKYPPEGVRPTCTGVRATQFASLNFEEYANNSNKELFTIGLIEDAEAVDVIDDIVSVEGFDVLMPGSGDLASSLGVPGQHTHPKVLEKLNAVIEGCKKSEYVAPGMYITDPALAKGWIDKGVKVFVVSIDHRFIYNTYRDAMRIMTGE